MIPYLLFAIFLVVVVNYSILTTQEKKMRCMMATVEQIVQLIEDNKTVSNKVVKEVTEILALVKKLREGSQPPPADIPGLEDFLLVNKATMEDLAAKLDVETPDITPPPTPPDA